MRFKKIYVEITNICNLNCSFCPKTSRAKKSLSVARFECILQKVKPYTDHLYFHVMGEPLLHPNLNDFLRLSNEQGLNVNLTTNGTRILEAQNALLAHPPRKISFSLHSFEGGTPLITLDKYIKDITDFTKLALAKNIIIEFRLWNYPSDKLAAKNTLNAEIIALIEQHLNVKLEKSELSQFGGVKLLKNCYLGFEQVFAWPDETLQENNSNVYCLALKDQIAILSDGTVVPCCLDNNGTIKLGNIFEDDLEQILESPLSKSIITGFKNRTAVCDLCKNCGFAKVKFSNNS